jgi:hypothetical protein
MVAKFGVKITLMAEEPNSLSVCQLANDVYHPGHFFVDQFFYQVISISCLKRRVWFPK